MTLLDPYMHDVHQQTDEYIKNQLTKKFPHYLYDPIYYVILNGGKKVRPTLLLLVAEYFGCKRDDILQVAVGIELFHIFSLVHDDIMDKDEFRRGNQTIHKKWDEATAILAGDGLIALSNMLMMSFQHPRIQEILSTYSTTILSVCEGQAFDKEFEQRKDVDLDEYLNMISLKTAWLLGASARIGAIIGSKDVSEWTLFNDFAFNLGIAFQIQDDILDLYADLDKLGKDIGSDLFNEKNSVLTIYARETGKFPSLKTSNRSAEVIKSIKAEFKINGVLDKAIALKETYTIKAKSCLKHLEDKKEKVILNELIDKLNSRVY